MTATRRVATELGPVRKRKLSDDVVERLEAAIRAGTYPTGASLPSERELMALFAVGRPSVREALFTLQKRGLVQIGAGERPKVTRPSPRHLLDELGSSARLLLDQPAGLDHFEQARLALEIYLVTHACRHGSEADFDRLEAALAANEATIGQAEAFIASDVGFHRVLTEMTGNPIFRAMHDAIVEWIIHERPLLLNTAENNVRSHAQHREILDALRRRDLLAAIDAMSRHLGDARARYSARPVAAPEASPSSETEAQNP